MRADVPRPARVPQRRACSRGARRRSKGGPWACAEHPTDRTYGPGLCPAHRGARRPFGDRADRRRVHASATATTSRARCARSRAGCCRERAVRRRRLRQRGAADPSSRRLRAEGVDVTAFASRSRASAEALARRMGRRRGRRAVGATRSGATTSMPSSIAAPNALHREVAVAAANAGKHVLVDKPMACTTDDADEMIAAAGANRRGARAVPQHAVRRAVRGRAALRRRRSPRRRHRLPRRLRARRPADVGAAGRLVLRPQAGRAAVA